MRYRRAKIAGATYFFTVVTEGRRPILKDASAVAMFEAGLNRIKERHPFDVDAYVILPDPHPYPLEPSRRRRQFLNTLAFNQGSVHEIVRARPSPTDAECEPSRERRAADLATPVLGTRDPGRVRFYRARRLHPLQSRPTWLGLGRSGLATLQLCRLGQSRSLRATLGC